VRSYAEPHTFSFCLSKAQKRDERKETQWAFCFPFPSLPFDLTQQRLEKREQRVSQLTTHVRTVAKADPSEKRTFSFHCPLLSLSLSLLLLRNQQTTTTHFEGDAEVLVFGHLVLAEDEHIFVHVLLYTACLVCHELKGEGVRLLGSKEEHKTAQGRHAGPSHHYRRDVKRKRRFRLSTERGDEKKCRNALQNEAPLLSSPSPLFRTGLTCGTCVNMRSFADSSLSVA
jgi:hypothetical protein